MFEREPYQFCATCGATALGLLSAGAMGLTRRCRACNDSFTEPLPVVDKKVIYLDQFAISEIHKIRAGVRRKGANSEAFWKRLDQAVNNAYLLQQAIFPPSDVHTTETTLFSDARALRQTHSMLGGDVNLHPVNDLAMRQSFAFADAFFEGQPPPQLTFEVDEILTGRRNAWLERFHISVDMDLSFFADGMRASREAGAEELAVVARGWAEDKPSFKRQLQVELQSFGRSRVSAVNSSLLKIDSALRSGDPEALVDASLNPYVNEFSLLRDHWKRRGLSENEASDKVLAFWDWEGNHHQPHHRISCYLFAALARKMSAGQKRPPGRGAFNDINAIAAYAPYVDAMFVDAECAGLLAEQPLASDLKYKAKIFSLRTGDAFIAYLEELSAAASLGVRAYAQEIYGWGPPVSRQELAQ